MLELHRLQELSKDITVLFVNDSKKFREESIEFLKKFFVIVDSASNGAEAFNLYQQNRYDLVITGIKMPLLNGLEFIKKMKEIDSKQTILVLSAYDFSELEKTEYCNHVDRFLLKPVASKKFITTLEELCLIIHSKDDIVDTNERLETIEQKISALEKKVDFIISKIKD